MKRKLSLILIISIICGMFTLPASAVTYSYCYIDAAELSQNISKTFMFRGVFENTDTEIFTCADIVKINGESYKKATDIASVIVPGLFVRFTLSSSGKVNRIDFDNTPASHPGIEYNKTTGKFSGISADLPIYYYYNFEFHIPTLDEEHIYDVDVYDYALCITKIEAKEKKETIDAIDISSGADYSFNQYISVMCQAQNTMATVCAKLYDEVGNYIAKSSSPVGDEIIFDIENKSANYKLDIWLEDTSGKFISYVYEQNYSVYEIPVYKGTILRKGIKDSIAPYIMLEIDDGNGNQTVYNCRDNSMFINKKLYKFKTYQALEQTLEEIPLNAEIDYIIENGRIKVIGFDDRVKPSFNTCKVENGTFIAEIKTENVLFDFSFMLAIYDKRGCLVKIVWETIFAQEDVKTISFEADEKYKGYTVKVLCWHKTRLSSASDVVSSSVAGE